MVCAGTKESDLVPVRRMGVFVDGRDIVVIKFLGVGGHTTAGKFVENLLVVRPTFNPLAISKTAMAEVARRVGRWNLMPTPHLQSHGGGDLLEVPELSR